jgi:hypothetical protein
LPLAPRQSSARALALDSKLADHVKSQRIAAYHLAQLLAEIEQSRVHQEFGHANIADYASERHSIPDCAALRRLGRHLPGLPLLGQAMADGQIGWTKAGHVAAVATPESPAGSSSGWRGDGEVIRTALTWFRTLCGVRGGLGRIQERRPGRMGPGLRMDRL